MDYLYFEFHYKGSESIWNFKRKNIDDKLDGLDGITCWSGYVEFDGEKRYFHKLWFWYITRLIMEILGEKETFIKLYLTCKTRIFKEFINGLP